MQLLQHLNQQKWTLWTATGNLQDDADAIDFDASNYKINENDKFITQSDAQTQFEKRF